MQIGDTNTIAILIARHGSALVLYARGLCPFPDDVVQEALMKLVAQKTMPDNPAAWLFRVVRNLAHNSNRAFSRRRKHERVKATESQSWFQSDAGEGIVAEEAVNALEQLDKTDREIVVARIWGQMSFEQIADLTSCSLSTAHRRYVGALSQLQNIMQAPATVSRKSGS